MKRLPLILIGAAVLLGLVIALTQGPGPAGRFANVGSCTELDAAFEAEPVGNAAERRAVGEEFRSKFDLLGC